MLLQRDACYGGDRWNLFEPRIRSPFPYAYKGLLLIAISPETMKTDANELRCLSILSLALLVIALAFCTVAVLNPSWMVADIREARQEHLVSF